MTKRIILHWTAGTNYPNTTDLQHYHFLIDKDGKVYNGVYTPEDNLNCYDGKYAQHTGGGNTGSIGIAVCGMAGYKNKLSDTKYPLTTVQIEKMFSLSAKLCKKYEIPITPDTVMTHYEFGKAYPKTSSAGKIDIICLHPFPNLSKNQIGDFIRSNVKDALCNLVNRKIH